VCSFWTGEDATFLPLRTNRSGSFRAIWISLSPASSESLKSSFLRQLLGRQNGVGYDSSLRHIFTLQTEQNRTEQTRGKLQANHERTPSTLVDGWRMVEKSASREGRKYLQMRMRNRPNSHT
jgi:hypothetical protein